MQPFIRVQSKENIKAPRHWPLRGEFTGARGNSPHKRPVTRKMLPFDDVIIYTVFHTLSAHIFLIDYHNPYKCNLFIPLYQTRLYESIFRFRNLCIGVGSWCNYLAGIVIPSIIGHCNLTGLIPRYFHPVMEANRWSQFRRIGTELTVFQQHIDIFPSV